MKKNTKYGITSTALFIGLIAIVVLVNVFVTVLVKKFPIKIDLTPTKLYEISETTYNYLKDYDKPTTIYILSAEKDEDKTIKNILEKYSQSNRNITLKNINPTEDPTFGTKYVEKGQSLYINSVIIECGERFKVYPPSELYGTSQNTNGDVVRTSIKAEQKITAGLKYVSSDTDFNAYFIQGHGEEELAGARKILENENYNVKDINLASEEIPEDAKMIVIAAPTNDYTMNEIAKLDKFFKNAGKAQIILNPKITGLNNLYSYIKDWGIQINDDYAVETNQDKFLLLGNSSMAFLIPELADNDITAPITESKRIMAYFPFSKSLTMLFEANNGIEVKPLLSTSNKAYTTTNLDNPQKDANSKDGTAVIAATAVKQGDTPDSDAIIFVTGSQMLLDINADVLSEYGFANADFYRNTISFLQGSKDDYTISSKSLIDSYRLNITESNASLATIILLVVIPVAVLTFGIVIWFRRRNL